MIQLRRGPALGGEWPEASIYILRRIQGYHTWKACWSDSFEANREDCDYWPIADLDAAAKELEETK